MAAAAPHALDSAHGRWLRGDAGPGHLWVMSSRCRYPRASSTCPSMFCIHCGERDAGLEGPPAPRGPLQLLGVGDRSGRSAGPQHPVSRVLRRG